MVHRKILPRAILYEGSKVIMKEMLILDLSLNVSLMQALQESLKNMSHW